jgi:cell filamentation protein
MSYSAGDDPLCYAGTSVLINKRGVRDQAQLDIYESAFCAARFEQVWPAGPLDVAHYLSLHHHLFQDVYEWAGTLRTVRIGKSGIWFCYPEHIKGEMAKLFDWLKSEDYFQSLSGMEFSMKAARFLSELNAIHPFREGNGRTQMSLLTILIDNSGLPFNVAQLEPTRAMDAMIVSFRGNLLPLEELIFDLVRA